MPNTIKPDEVEEALTSIENQENKYNHREVLLSIKEGPGTSGYTPSLESSESKGATIHSCHTDISKHDRYVVLHMN
jgi:hypothetical protein